MGNCLRDYRRNELITNVHRIYRKNLTAEIVAIASNRDEFYDRPSKGHIWESGIVAGKDLVNDGTWLGITPGGQFSLVTNFRD
ncbi:MAG: NRDE family protein [Bdellovibrionales bacterium]